MSYDNRKKRTRSGCLTCRRRKVKCKEEKPVCSGCLKSNYQCLWPENGVQSLSRRDLDAFKVEKANLQKNLTFYVYNGDSNKTERLKETEKNDDLNLSLIPQHTPPYPDLLLPLFEDPLFPKDETEEKVEEVSKVLGSPELSVATGWWDQLNVYDENAFLFHTFLNGFLRTVSPQFCHPQLLPATNFVRLGLDNPVMRDIFNACAASFLSQQSPELQVDAQNRYALSVGQFSDALAFRQDDTVDEWMVGALLLFCLRDKFSGCKPQIPALHLSKAFEILQKLSKQGNVSPASLKFLAECLTFNYSVMLLTADDNAVRALPSPFSVYNEFRAFNDLVPFTSCVPFMNNPVSGAAKDIMEVCAKTSWLYSKYPLNPADMSIACNLLGVTYSYKPPSVDLQFFSTFPQKELARLHESVSVADILALCCRLLLTKLVVPTLLQTDPQVQTIVAAIHGKFLTIDPQSPIWIACSWPLLVCGICATDPMVQKYVLERCCQNSERYQMKFLKAAVLKFKYIWGCTKGPGTGWDCLFDRAFLLDMCF